jgi:hypothetical protein
MIALFTTMSRVGGHGTFEEFHAKLSDRSTGRLTDDLGKDSIRIRHHGLIPVAMHFCVLHCLRRTWQEGCGKKK